MRIATLLALIRTVPLGAPRKSSTSCSASVNGTNHFQYYDQPDIVDRTVGHAADWFREHMA